MFAFIQNHLSRRLWLALALVLAAPAGLFAQWSIDAAHTNVMFSIDHMMISETVGRFKQVDGSISATKDDFSDAEIEVKIPISSINTDNADRDKHLQAEDFFDAAKYPYLKFKSTSVKKIKGNEYAVSGNLTIRDKTHPVTLKGRFVAPMKDPMGNMRAGFAKLQTTIDRQDYGVAGGGMMVGDEVRITINVELVKKG